MLIVCSLFPFSGESVYGLLLMERTYLDSFRMLLFYYAFAFGEIGGVECSSHFCIKFNADCEYSRKKYMHGRLKCHLFSGRLAWTELTSTDMVDDSDRRLC